MLLFTLGMADEGTFSVGVLVESSTEEGEEEVREVRFPVSGTVLSLSFGGLAGGVLVV